MIGRFAVDPRALTGTGETGHALRNQNSRLARTIMEFGVLNLMGERDQRELVEALREQINALGYDFWTKVLRALASEGPGVMWATPPRQKSTRDYLESGKLDELRGLVELVIVDGDHSRVPGLDASLADSLYDTAGYANVDNSLELVLPSAVDECRTLYSLREMRKETVIQPGVSNGDLWASYFSPLARTSTRVDLFDKFFFSGLMPRRSLDYLLWILNSLDRDLPPTAEVNIYAYSGQQVARESKDRSARAFDIADIAKALRQLSRWNRPGRLNVFLCERMDHDRHMRFNCGHAFMSQAGFDHLRFDGDRRLRNRFSYAYVAPGKSLETRIAVENDVRNLVRQRRQASRWVLKSKKGGLEEAALL